MTDYKAGQEAMRAALGDMGVTVAATFVPQSASRNSGEKAPTLNWRVTVQRPGRRSFATDYQQGIGHAPGYVHLPPTLYNEHNLKLATEKGKYPLDWRVQSHNGKPLPPPDACDVVACLLSDGDAYGEPFEEWAMNYGYDPDSRKAEAIYHACQEVGRAMSRLFTGEERDRLRDLANDAGL